MKFETKFDINDDAWCMNENKPAKVLVSEVYVHHEYADRQYDIEYLVTYEDKSYSKVEESNLFESKNKLSEFLFGIVAERVEEVFPGTNDALNKLNI